MCIFLHFAIARHFCGSYGELKMNEIEKAGRVSCCERERECVCGRNVISIAYIFFNWDFFLCVFNHAKMHE